MTFLNIPNIKGARAESTTFLTAALSRPYVGAAGLKRRGGPSRVLADPPGGVAYGQVAQVLRYPTVVKYFVTAVKHFIE